MNKNFCINLIIFPLIIILINYYFYKKNILENFSDNNSNLKLKINEELKKNYNFNFPKFRELSDILKALEKNDSNVVDETGTEKNSIENVELNVLGNINLIPKGVIIAYYGNNPPVGWAICDGRDFTDFNGTTKKTPDLTDKFIMSTNDLNQIGKTGGEKEYKLNSENLMIHAHTTNPVGEPHFHYHEDIYLQRTKGNRANIRAIDKNDRYANVAFKGNIRDIGNQWFMKDKLAYGFTYLAKDKHFTNHKTKGDSYCAHNDSSRECKYKEDQIYLRNSYHNHDMSVNYDKTLENKPITLMPPHYTLIYIIKI